MVAPFILLQYMMCLHLVPDPRVQQITEHCHALKLGGNAAYNNKVCGSSETSDADIRYTKAYFDTTPFVWLVDSSDTALIQLLEQFGFIYKNLSFTGMALDLTNLDLIHPYKPGVTVQEIYADDQENLRIWDAIAVATIQVPNNEFALFRSYLNTAQPGMVHYYLGYYNNQPVATSMTVQRGDIVSLHLVNTLSEYRNKGLGYAVTIKALLDAQDNGFKCMVLYSTESARPLYESLGFNAHSICLVYRAPFNNY